MFLNKVAFCFFCVFITDVSCTESLRHRPLTRKEPTESYDTSKLLNKLLKNYDYTLRPEKKPTQIKVDIFVRSMSKISELDMEYSFECYFRQRWQDKRLAFNDSLAPDTLTISVKTIDKIWKPFTYIENARHSHIHSVPSSNRFFRISRDGSVLYSMRLTVTAKCPMDLTNFPIDEQSCQLHISSLAYTTSEVIFEWRNPIKLSRIIGIAQFDILGTEIGNQNYSLHNQNFSRLIGVFKLSRHISYFVLQIYIPCLLVVALSWIGLYINKKDTTDRCSLGATSLLTCTILKMDCYSDMPKISYLTALDYYIITCYGFVVFSILEFAFVHQDKFDYEEYAMKVLELKTGHSKSKRKCTNRKNLLARNNLDRIQFKNQSNLNVSRKVAQRLMRKSSSALLLENCKSVYRTSLKYTDISRLLVLHENSIRVNKIDQISKILFPTLFTVFNLIYFIYYLNQRSVFSK